MNPTPEFVRAEIQYRFSQRRNVNAIRSALLEIVIIAAVVFAWLVIYWAYLRFLR